MASGGATQVYNSSLGGSGSVDTVWLSGGGSSIKVTNLTGTAPIFFTVSFPGGPCPVPTINGTADYVATTAGMSTNVRTANQFGAIVQLVSASVQSYMCEVQSSHATS